MGKSNSTLPSVPRAATSNGAQAIRGTVSTAGDVGVRKTTKNMNHWLELPVGPSLNDKFVSRTFRVSREWHAYLKTVRVLARAQNAVKIDGPVEMSIKWYRSAKRGDIDSKLKCLLDALEGVCYEDDAQIQKITVERSDYESKNPRLVVNVRPFV